MKSKSTESELICNASLESGLIWYPSCAGDSNLSSFGTCPVHGIVLKSSSPHQVSSLNFGTGPVHGIVLKRVPHRISDHLALVLYMGLYLNQLPYRIWAHLAPTPILCRGFYLNRVLHRIWDHLAPVLCRGLYLNRVPHHIWAHLAPVLCMGIVLKSSSLQNLSSFVPHSRAANYTKIDRLPHRIWAHVAPVLCRGISKSSPLYSIRPHLALVLWRGLCLNRFPHRI